jgi:hypothetical protein
MLCGRLPYGAQLPALRTRTDRARLAYASVLDERRAIPAWVDDVLMKAVHPLPHKRHEALSEFVHELRHGPSAAPRLRPLAERNPVRFWQTLAAVLGALVLVQLALLQSRATAHVNPFPQSTAETRR